MAAIAQSIEFRLELCEPATAASQRSTGTYVMRSRFKTEGGRELDVPSTRRSHTATDRSILRAHVEYGVALPERLDRSYRIRLEKRAEKLLASGQAVIVGCSAPPARNANHPVLCAVECARWTNPNRQTKLSTTRQRPILEMLRAAGAGVELDMFDIMYRLGYRRLDVSKKQRKSDDTTVRGALYSLEERGLVRLRATRGRYALTWVSWTGLGWDAEP